MASTSDLDKTIICQRCDTLINAPHLSAGEKASCPYCGNIVRTRKKHTIDKPLAISLAGLLLFIPATQLPLIGISAAGQYSDASIIDCISILINTGQYFIAFCVFVFILAFPAVRLFTAFYLTYSLTLKKRRPFLAIFFRSYNLLENWTMSHIFFLGIVISIYKLVDLASLSIGAGMLSLVMFLICSTLLSATLDHQSLWQNLERCNA